MGKVGQVRPGLAKEIGARDPVLVAQLTRGRVRQPKGSDTNR